MESLRDWNRPRFRYQLKVQIFRALTTGLAWGLLAAVYYQKPEILTSAERLLQRGFEAISDAFPLPWGPGIGSAFRDLGGLIWLQITLVILAIRVMLSAIGATWRLTSRTTEPSSSQGMHDSVALAIYAVLTFSLLSLIIFILQE